jgi:hypothetical protein
VRLVRTRRFASAGIGPRALGRRWWIAFAICVVLGLVVAGLGSQLPPKRHSSISPGLTPTPRTAGHRNVAIVPSASPGNWVNLTPFLRLSPGAASDAAFAYDPSMGYGLLFGGQTPFATLRDTWKFSASTWTSLTPLSPNLTNSPSARYGAAMAYDPQLKGYLLFGGKGPSGWLNDTWLWNGSWQRLSPNLSPAPRAYATLVDAPALWPGPILFGGNAVAPLNDTWEYLNGTWTNLTTSVGGPPVRYGMGMAFDSLSREIVLFGGVGADTSGAPLFYADTWLLNRSGWSIVATDPTPGPRLSPVEVFDPSDGAVLLYGGVAPQGTRWGDLWTYSNASWTEVSTSENATLAARSGAAAAVVNPPGSTGATVVLFGGSISVLEITADTWVLGDPLPLGVAGPVSPTTTIDAGQRMVFDALAFGGRSPYTYVWQFTASFCPPANSSVISCVPTVPPSLIGSSLFASVNVSDSVGLRVASSAVEVFVNSPPSAQLVVLPSILTLGSPVIIWVNTTGGTAPVVRNLSGLPPGCVIPPAAISKFHCTPTESGSYHISANVTDSVGVRNSTSTVGLVVSAATSTRGPGPELEEILVVVVIVAVVVAVVWIVYRRSKPRQKAPSLSPAPPPAR